MNPLEPAPTALDLKWRLFGIHFRVHPSFWLVSLLFGYILFQNQAQTGRQLVIYLGLWTACAFVSILVHELGHVLTARTFGERGNILLYSMGGLAVGQYQRLHRGQRILMTLAGPGAGLLLFAFVYFAMPELDERFNLRRVNPWYFDIVLWVLILQNLFWSLFNLIPILPLDGGMIMRDLVTGVAPRSGLYLAYGLSFLIAGSLAGYSALVMYRPELPYPPLYPLFNVLIFGMFAFQSLMAMQTVAAEEKRRSYDERDW